MSYPHNSHCEPEPLRAGGDLGGYYPNPRVRGIQRVRVSHKSPTTGQVLQFDGRKYTPTTLSGGGGDATSLQGTPISSTVPTEGQFLIFDGTDWIPSPSTAPPSGGPYGQILFWGDPAWTLSSSPATNSVLIWNGTAWVPQTIPGGDLAGPSSTYAAPVIGKIQGQPITATGATSGQVLGWSGTTWHPITVSGGGGNATQLQSTNIDPTLLSKATQNGQFLVWNGSQWTVNLASGPSGLGQMLFWDTGLSTPSWNYSSSPTASGQVLVWGGTAWAPGTPTIGGSAGGDLSGTYPDPKVVAIQGTAIDPSLSPGSGSALVWNGSEWTSAIPGGDVTGSYDNALTVQGLQGRPVSATLPAGGSALIYLSGWVPQTSPQGDLARTLTLTTSTYAAPVISSIQGVPITATGATSGQVLGWSGSAWVPTAGGGSGTNASQLRSTNIDPGLSSHVNGTYNGQLLVWTASNNQWQATDIPPGGISFGQMLYWDTSIGGFWSYTFAPGTGQMNFWVGTQWELTDTPSSNGQFLVWNQGSTDWNVTPAPSSNGQVPIWNGSTWVPGTPTIGAAGGDLSGTYPNPTVAKIQGTAIDSSLSTNASANGQFLVWNGSEWTVNTNSGPNGNGQMLYWNGSDWTYTTAPSANGQLYFWFGGQWNSTATPTTSGQFLAWDNGSNTWNVTTSPTIPSQILFWNGGSWTPTAATSPTDGQVLTWDGTGNTWYPSTPTLGGAAGGDLTGTYPNPTIGSILGGTVYQSSPPLSSSDNGYMIWWNGASGPNGNWVIGNASTVTGDLAGNYPSPSIQAIQGAPVVAASPGNGAALIYNGSYWAAQVTPGGDLQYNTYAAPVISSIQSQTVDVTSLGPTSGQFLGWNGSTKWVPLTPTLGGAAGGDLIGTYPNPTIQTIQNQPITATGANLNQGLVWNGSAWVPTNVLPYTTTINNTVITFGAGDSGSTKMGTIAYTLPASGTGLYAANIRVYVPSAPGVYSTSNVTFKYGTDNGAQVIVPLSNISSPTPGVGSYTGLLVVAQNNISSNVSITATTDNVSSYNFTIYTIFTQLSGTLDS